MPDRLGFERELNLLNEAVALPLRERETAQNASALDGYFSSVDQKRSEAEGKHSQLRPLLQTITIRMILQRDRCLVRAEGDPVSHIYPIELTNSTAGVYYVEWNSNCNPRRIISLESGKPENRKPWSDPTLAGHHELSDLRCQRKGLVWVTQTIGKTSSSAVPGEFPLANYRNINYEEAQELIKQVSARPLIVVGERRAAPPPPGSPPGTPRSVVIEGLAGGIFPSGRYQDRPLNFTYWTHDGVDAIVSRRYLCNDKDKTQCMDFYYVVPILDIESFLRFWPLEAAGQAAAGMAILWQIVMEIGVNFIPIIGPIYGLIQTTRSVVDAYTNWDRMKGWEKALVGVDVLFTVVPGAKTVTKGVKGAGKVEESTEALVKAGLTQKDARRLAVSSLVLQSEKKTLEAVEQLSLSMRKGNALAVHEMLVVEKAYNTLLKGIPAGERLLEQARIATRDLDAAKEFFQDVTLTDVHLTGLRAMTPEVLVTLRAAAKDNSTIVKQVMHSAGQSRDVAWGIIHLETAVRPEHLAHLAASLGDDVMRDLGRGVVDIPADLGKLAKAEKSLEKAYQKLMGGGRTQKVVDGKRKMVNVDGLASVLRKARPQPLAAELVILEKQFPGLYLTQGQLKGIAQLDSSLQQALVKGARPADVHRVATIASTFPQAAPMLNDLGGKLLAAKPPVKWNVAAVLGRLDPGYVDLMLKTGVKVPDSTIAAAAKKVGAGDAFALLLQGRKGRGAVTGLNDVIADALNAVGDPIAVLARVHNRPQAGRIFARWALANRDRVKGVSAIVAVKKAAAADKIKDIYLGFPNDFQSIIQSIGDLHDKFDPGGLDLLINNLATAGITKFAPEIGQGASLTLAYAVKNMKAAHQPRAFEVTAVISKDLKRQWDLMLGDMLVECKLWSHFTGAQVIQAQAEFAKDLLHLISKNQLDFANLKWVFSGNMETYRGAIVQMMESVLTTNPMVLEALRKGGKDLNVVRDSLRRATDASTTGGMLEFFGR